VPHDVRCDLMKARRDIFAGDDVHADINLAGVGGDDFAAKLFGNFKAKTGFTSGCRAAYNEDFVHALMILLLKPHPFVPSPYFRRGEIS